MDPPSWPPCATSPSAATAWPATTTSPAPAAAPPDTRIEPWHYSHNRRINYAETLTPGATIDGVTLSNGDRVALLGQTTASQNGIYIFNGASSALTRAKDADTGTELVNATFYVCEGTSNADTVWTCTTNAAITVDTTSLTFAQVNGGTVPTATTSVAGKVQLADQTETEARSSTTKAVTPGDLANFPYTTEHTIGDGSSTSIAITHSRGRKGVVVQVRQA